MECPDKSEGRNKNQLVENYDVAVVGAGHAGCEAALACARLGLETIIFTVSVDSIALMPCNPNIGGSSKGHLVREIDALGGQMGINIDKTFIQSKMLNRSKGPAVHSLRAQADKADYSMQMRMTLQSTDHLTIRQAEVAEIIAEDIKSIYSSKEDNSSYQENFDGDEAFVSSCQDSLSGVAEDNNSYKDIRAFAEDVCQEEKESKNNSDLIRSQKIIKGIKTVSGATYYCKAVILCTGTYLRARCLTGEMITYTGPNGLMAANYLTDSLKQNGIEMLRFKTGTPARMDKRTIDFSKMQEQKGDERIVPFSFTTNPEDVQIDQVSCWLTYTNEQTHEIIRENLSRSPIYAGVIEGTGPRYCPSIEDKVVKFPDKERHQLFIEPEGIHTNEMYVGGMSSSLPEDVQYAMYRTVPGLEAAEIVRCAYAIEYDCMNPNQLDPSLEFKNIRGLFSGGQFNGSSGYEEAAAQGLIAGINAAMQILGKEPLILDRSEAYIGVLIDDLVTKENHEPYRMMTSRAEYRLLLRQDNADLRLTKKGYEVGLISKERYDRVVQKEQQIQKEVERISHVTIGANQKTQDFLEKYQSVPLNTGATLSELIRRPELNYDLLAELDEDRPDLDDDVAEQVNINIKYDGYIKRQMKQVESFKKLEKKRLEKNFDYDAVSGLRMEAKQKLNQYQPLSIGQASRISGVSPADISVLLVYLEQYYHNRNKNRK
ncbi:MAG: tRNA uridine-5-carboxymethylaminomethyl(34) synthesis enzyme MnmG [Eubacterium sp.]|nr:tRNA uridine-5-carboxymethylaminomethyl(34) synthesis enzyme MnmG [Eubacterium sp.]